ncbi:MAG: ribonuclease H-like domain-containing protein [Clostridia bacterium]
MSLKNKLNRMKSHLSLETGQAPTVPTTDSFHASQDGATPTPSASSSPILVPFSDKWAELLAKPYGDDEDYIMVREVRYPLAHWHGRYSFDQLHDVIRAWEASELSHPLSAAGMNAENLLFFDTETTGLHGGTGNTIFLLGYSRIIEDEVVVRQHFLAAPHSEVTLYQSFLEDVRDSTHLVTYNGKSFDWPQVKTRHTLVRDEVPALPTFGHYDLLHGARRMWKRDLESCRLAIIEQEKLGVKRTNDLPGYLAPVAYFEYLHDFNPDPVEGVLHHNEWDVLSLITLYIHLSKLLIEYHRDTPTLEELFEISRWYELLGQDGAAMHGFSQIAESPHPLQAKAKLALGQLYKKQRQYIQAISLWESCLEDASPVADELLIELAKLIEHQEKDYEKALRYTSQAYDLWKKKTALLRYKPKAEQNAFHKRIDRLQKKIDRG